MAGGVGRLAGAQPEADAAAEVPAPAVAHRQQARLDRGPAGAAQGRGRAGGQADRRRQPEQKARDLAAVVHQRQLGDQAHVADPPRRRQGPAVDGVGLALVDQPHRQVDPQLEAIEQPERRNQVDAERRVEQLAPGLAGRSVPHDEPVVGQMQEQPSP